MGAQAHVATAAFGLQLIPAGAGENDGGNSGKTGLADAENPARLAGQQFELPSTQVRLPHCRGNRKHFLG